MYSRFFYWFAFLVCQIQTDTLLVDNRYLEDQFYLGLTYNFLLEKPDAVSQSNLSYGLQGGLIKDIPLNEERNIAMGLGVGYGYYTYYSNLRLWKIMVPSFMIS
ncbi:outer membrane beta-barrel protein [Winogradskyella maritima]|nr:outer membrane beta-barrel protein [Winogradskyella maritima]